MIEFIKEGNELLKKYDLEEFGIEKTTGRTGPYYISNGKFKIALNNIPVISRFSKKDRKFILESLESFLLKNNKEMNRVLLHMSQYDIKEKIEVNRKIEAKNYTLSIVVEPNGIDYSFMISLKNVRLNMEDIEEIQSYETKEKINKILKETRELKKQELERKEYNALYIKLNSFFLYGF